jgi:hypothetical protein
MSIQRDLLIGKQAEQRLVTLLEKASFSCNIDNKYEWDISATKKLRKTTLREAVTLSLTFEVKCDLMAAKTGNIAIEFYNTRSVKASGIDGTKADFWVHITDAMYIIETNQLKSLIKSVKPKRIITSGGDGNASLYLYPTSFLDENFRNLEKMSVKEINSYLNREN